MIIEHTLYSLSLDSLVIIKQNTIANKITLITEFGEDSIHLKSISDLEKNLKLVWVAMENICV